MSGSIIRIDELSEAIRQEIDSMNQEVIEKCNEAAENAAKEGVKELKAKSPVRADGYARKYPPGSYAKSWTLSKEGSTLGVTNYTIHNKKHYQLTHLLEFGHIIPSTGKRSRTFPHIGDVNDKVSRDFVDAVEGMKL